MPKYTIIDLAENEVRLLLVNKTKKRDLVVEAIAEVDFSDIEKVEGADVARGQRLRETMKRLRMTGHPAALLIPKQNSIVRTTVLPSGDPDELAEMAQFEAEKYIPFNAERHIISNAVLHRDEVAGSQVLITAVDGPVMEVALGILKEATVEPHFAEVSSVALVRSFAATQENLTPDASIILLYISRSQTEISVLRGGNLVATRSQAVGLGKLLKDLQDAMHLERAVTLRDLATLDMTNPDAFLLDGGSTSESAEGEGRTRVGDVVRNWMQRIVRFTGQSFEFTAREYDVPAATAVYISGEASALHGFDQALSVELNVDVLDFFPLRSFANQPVMTADPFLARGLTPAHGTALRLIEEADEPNSRGDRINLLPPEYIELQEASERKVLLMVSGTMVVITLILLFLAFDTQARHTALLTERYRDYNRTMKPTIDELDKKREQLEIIRQITENRAGPLFILDQIAQFPGAGSTVNGGVLTLTEFKYTVRNEVTIGGTAVNFEDMQRFADYLERLTYEDKLVFSSVGLPQPTPVTLSHNRGNVHSFTINAMLNDFTAPAENEESDS